MSKRSPARSTPVPPVFHAPVRIDWSDEKLAALSQPELLTLLDNLDQQRSIGRLADSDASALDTRIVALLSRASRTRRNKTLKAAAAAKAAAA